MLTDKRRQAAEELYLKGLVSYPRTETDQFAPGFDFQNLIGHQTGDARWGNFAQQSVSYSQESSSRSADRSGTDSSTVASGHQGTVQRTTTHTSRSIR